MPFLASESLKAAGETWGGGKGSWQKPCLTPALVTGSGSALGSGIHLPSFAGAGIAAALSTTPGEKVLRARCLQRRLRQLALTARTPEATSLCNVSGTDTATPVGASVCAAAAVCVVTPVCASAVTAAVASAAVFVEWLRGFAAPRREGEVV